MKKQLLTLIAVLVLFHAPWRLMFLGLEVFAMSPGPTRVHEGNDLYWQTLTLELRLIELGWQVKFQEGMKDENLYGLTSPGERTIKIEESLSWNARMAVLAHEGGHTLEPAWLNRDEGEIFAESVAMLISHDGLREHARYLADRKMTFLLVTLIEWPAIYRAARMLEN